MTDGPERGEDREMRHDDRADDPRPDDPRPEDPSELPPRGDEVLDAAFGRAPLGADEATGQAEPTASPPAADPPAAPPEYSAEQAEQLEVVLERAHRLGEEADYAGMVEHLDEALEDFPDDPFVLCWLGVAERELGLDTMAYERFKQCLAAQPTDPYVLATAGNAVAAFDDPDAEPALRAAAVMAPHLALARWMYGAYLSREGFPDKAVEELRAALELDPDDPVIAFELGVAHALGGNRLAALDAVYRAAEMDREDGWTLVVLGLLLVEDDRVDEAVAELSAGARLRPEDVEAQLVTALAAAAAGMDALAWEMLERGRQRAQGGDREVAEAVDRRLTEGPESSLRFLRERLAPTALRERLMTRP